MTRTAATVLFLVILLSLPLGLAGPPAPETVKRDLDFYAQKYPGVKVRVGQLSDFYDALTREELDRVPVVRGDMPDCWIHGPASSPDGCKAIVTARPLLPATEFLATLNAAWGVKTENPQEALAAAYEQSLLWSEHTWGLANIDLTYKKEGPITKAIPGPEKDIDRMLDSWQEHLDYARRVQKILDKPCADQLTALAKQVQVTGKRVVVFNSLPWQRDDVVDVEGNWGLGAVVQTTDGQVVASEVNGRLLRFVAQDVPSLGYRTYRIVASSSETSPANDCAADEKSCVIESPAFRVAFDPNHGRVDAWPEACWLNLPFEIASPRHLARTCGEALLRRLALW